MPTPPPGPSGPGQWPPLLLGHAADLGGRPVHLPAAERGKHLYVCGATGSGKSKLVEYLVRQDIVNRPQSGEGVVLLDPHGAIYEATLSWLAANPRLTEGGRRPVVPLDFRGGDHLPSYDLLRRRPGSNPAKVIDDVARAVAHVWGAAGVKETPRFATWVRNALWPLYVNGRPLSDLGLLLHDRTFRANMLAGVTERMIVEDWRRAEADPRWFREVVESTVNRLGAFVLNPVLRAIFGDPGASFDWRAALDGGWIVLANLSPDGGRVSEENMNLVGTLLMTDLWAAVRDRGKPAGRARWRPTNLYADEFQRLVTPSVAEALSESRGYGLRCCFSHQFPSQINDHPAGERVHKAILANAANRLAFCTRIPEDLEVLAAWMFREGFDPMRVKQEIYQQRAVGQRVEHLESFHESETESGAESYTVSVGRSRTDAEGWSVAVGTNWSEGGSDSLGVSMTEGATFGPPSEQVPGLLAQIAPFLATIPEEPDPRTTNLQVTTNLGHVDTYQSGGSEVEVHSSSSSTSESESSSRGVTRGHARTRGRTLAPVVFTVYRRELASRTFLPLAEQEHEAMRALMGQGARVFFAKLDGVAVPVQLRSPDVSEPVAKAADVAVLWEGVLGRWPFIHAWAEAERRRADHEAAAARLSDEGLLAGEPDGPESFEVDAAGPLAGRVKEGDEPGDRTPPRGPNMINRTGGRARRGRG